MKSHERHLLMKESQIDFFREMVFFFLVEKDGWFKF